jgi:hypothetical protein
MLNAAGYGMSAPKSLPPPSEIAVYVTNRLVGVIPPFGGYSTEGIKYIPGLFARQPSQNSLQKEPEVFAVMSDVNFIAEKPPNNTPSFMVFTASENNPNGGKLFAYHPTDNPDAIVVGICNALIEEGISVGFMSSKGILPDGQAGFFIPQKIY